MASYKYEVVVLMENQKTGTIEAMNMEVASAELNSAATPSFPSQEPTHLTKDLEIHIGKAVSVREMSVFCCQFESVLNAGVTVVEALDMLSEQTENQTVCQRKSQKCGIPYSAGSPSPPRWRSTREDFSRISWCRWLPPGNPPGGPDKAFSRGKSV